MVRKKYCKYCKGYHTSAKAARKCAEKAKAKKKVHGWNT
jgi:hypothetical protein